MEIKNIIVAINEDYKSCEDCIHSEDSMEICILRQCVHAVCLIDRYVPQGSDKRNLVVGKEREDADSN